MKITTKQLQHIIREELQNTLDERCWDGYERNPEVPKGERGSCRVQTDEAELAEDDVKKDACYKKIKAAVKAKDPSDWPSAYASGRLVQCRKKGAANWKEGEPKKEGLDEAEISDDEKEELEDVSGQLKAAVKAHGKQAKTIDKALKKEEKNFLEYYYI